MHFAKNVLWRYSQTLAHALCKLIFHGWSLIFASDHNTITTMMINKPITGFLNQTFNMVQI